jgi:hypothetical protein
VLFLSRKENLTDPVAGSMTGRHEVQSLYMCLKGQCLIENASLKLECSRIFLSGIFIKRDVGLSVTLYFAF